MEVSYNTCTSLSDLLHLVCYTLGQSMLLQIELFHFYGLVVFHFMCVYIFIHSPVDKHLVHVHVLAIVYNAAVNFGVCASF